MVGGVCCAAVHNVLYDVLHMMRHVRGVKSTARGWANAALRPACGKGSQGSQNRHLGAWESTIIDLCCVVLCVDCVYCVSRAGGAHCVLHAARCAQLSCDVWLRCSVLRLLCRTVCSCVVMWYDLAVS